MFFLVVVMLFLVVVGAVSFTDLVDNGFRSAGATLAQALRDTRPNT